MIKKLKFKSKFLFSIFSISSISAFVLSACSDILSIPPRISNNHSEQEPSNTNSDTNASPRIFPNIDDNQSSVNSSRVIPSSTGSETSKPTNSAESKSKDSVDENDQHRIRYVALGDSITAGYNGDLAGIDTSGDFDTTARNITGWSYPSYFASYIEQTQPGLIGSYHNLGLSGSTIDDWLYLLGDTVSGYRPENRFNLFNSLKEENKKYENPYQNRFDTYFGQGVDAFKQKGFTESLKKIKAANLITIALSANDFFNKFNFANLFGKTNLTQLGQQINLVVEEIETNYIKLVNKLQSLNPQATIVLVNYPQPLLRLTHLINQELAKTFKNQGLKTNNYLEFFFDSINQIPRGVYTKLTNKNKVNFVSVFNPTFWKQHSKELTHNLFDIHPTKYGQKQIGLELFLKLSLDQTQIKSHDEENPTGELKKLNPFWAMDEQYLIQDLGTFRQFLKFDSEKNFSKLVSQYAGTLSDPLTLKDNLPNDTNLDLSKIGKKENWSSPLRFFLNNLANSNDNANLYNVLKSLLFPIATKTDKLDQFMTTVYAGKSNFVHMLNYLLEDGSFLSNTLNGLVKKLDSLENQNFDKAVLEQTLQTTFSAINPLNYLSIITKLLDLSTQDFIKNQLEKIQELIKPNGDLNTIVVNLVKQFLPKLATLDYWVKSLLGIGNKNLNGLVEKSNFEATTQKFAHELLTIFLAGSSKLSQITAKLASYIDELNSPSKSSPSN
ncbi:lysophospholipase L1-like esterase [Mycoplasmoides fastidiosum]|uniref:Lysophospholipase L1-like esterase n=1 Tax=Mycoplasmoides fastidiosum TaxID=92758 RepID=A0ABU0LZB3_9BACT|nr:SGNH/GDSL hydrolase family protein [Mycoplasmoides fastidiosum]MDQ0514041.1 lysophospholipase L1-like esterase [Mycoplasmoides fastidiosum]